MPTEEKVLVIRKPDRTIHQVALENKAVLMAYSNRLPDGLKWDFETMSKGEAAKLPFINKEYVSGGEAVEKLKVMETESSEKDLKIAELEAKLIELTNAKPGGSLNAVDVIAKINAAGSQEEIRLILGADDRKTVIDAAAKKMESF